MMHLQNQRLLQGLLKFQFNGMWKSSVFLLENMVLMKNLRSLSQGGLPEMDILKRNGKRTSASIVKHGPTMTWKGSGDKLKLQRYEAHQRSIKEWETRVQASELHYPAIPCGPTPEGTSSMRALPDVHEALRQNDPRMVSHSQPVVKKAPPSTGRPKPSVFYSDAEPPRIGAPVQPPPPAAQRPAETQGLDLPLAATPMTPSHPPRPPIEALPKHPSMEMSSCATKHPLEPPTAQGPPSKHVRSKAFPYSSPPPDQVFMAASAAVDMPQASRPCPKGPPAAYMPTPPEVMSMQTGSSREERRSRMNDEGKYVKIKSVLDIDWESSSMGTTCTSSQGRSRSIQVTRRAMCNSSSSSRVDQPSARRYLSSRQCHHCSAEESWCP